MAKNQTPEQHAAFQLLCRDNNLDPRADVWQQPQSGTWIISRTGIEKIQGKNRITVALEMVRCEPDFACVKASATRSVKVEGKATTTKLVIESFGSALPANCKVSYYAEMAEKRALSRAVLKIMGFYELGVYGEDEADSFTRPVPAANSVATAEQIKQFAPKKQLAEAAASASQPLAPSTTAAPSSNGEPEAEALAETYRALAAATSTIELKNLWVGLANDELRTALQEEFSAARTRINTAVLKATSEKVSHTIIDTVSQKALEMEKPKFVITELDNRPPADEHGEEIIYATEAQKQEIIRLINHPVISRQQKTTTLLKINRFSQSMADQIIIDLTNKIGETEGDAAQISAAAGLRKWIRESSMNGLIPLLEADRLLTISYKGTLVDIRREWIAAQDALKLTEQAA